MILILMNNKLFQQLISGQYLPSIFVLLSSVIASYLYVQFGNIVFILIIVLIIFAFYAISSLRGNASSIKSISLIPLIVLSIPVQRIFLTTYGSQVIGQLAIFPVVLYFWMAASPSEKIDILKKINLLFIPSILFVLTIICSYILSGDIDKESLTFLLSLAGSLGYAYLACIYCSSLRNIKRILWVFILIGIIQLPVMYATYRGWTSNLPGTLAELNNGNAWMSDGQTYRYPGIFGDFELLAEYLGMMAIICIGFFMFGRKKLEQFFFFISLFLIIIAGFFTGSRTFIAALGAGTVFILLFMTINKETRGHLWKLLLMASLLSLFVAFLSTQEVFIGFISRYVNMDLSSGSLDTRNVVWTVTFNLLPKMPFWGYGTVAMNVFNIAANSSFLVPHSLYFSMLLIAGYPGFIASIILAGVPVFWMLRVFFVQVKMDYRFYAIIFILIGP